jgi:hypothetical protein
MNRVIALLPSIAVLMVLWQECGEHPALFCYRIGVGAYATVRSRARVPGQTRRTSWQRPLRNRFACSNSSGICSIPSTTSKD